jgi:hypothetical protein
MQSGTSIVIDAGTSTVDKIVCRRPKHDHIDQWSGDIEHLG